MEEIAGPGLPYYWTSEVAKDYLFESADALLPLMDDFQLHVLVSGKGERILKYFGWAKDMSGKQLSARISRHLRLLREQGLIKNCPNRRGSICSRIRDAG